MSNPYLGEIRMFAGNFAPAGWALCNGQILAISTNQALFSILGTTYGGNGINNFQLPNLQGRVPMHMGTNPVTGTPYYEGQTGDVEHVTLSVAQMPLHTHLVNAVNGGGNSASPQNNLPAVESTGTSLDFSNAAASVTMNAGMISANGGSTPVPIIQPYQVVNFIIALVGIFPSRN
jgi:microcystin-dependent protein